MKIDLRAEDLLVSLSGSPHLSGTIWSEDIFVLKVYFKAWYTCACTTSAPRHDLTLEAYKNQDPAVAKAAIANFSHLRQISEMLIRLALIDPQVTHDMKVDVVRAVQRQRSDEPPHMYHE